MERFQSAAEMYGYIVAGSNQSRNGSWEVSMASIGLVSADLSARFRIDEKRIYTAGLSGRARVAMQVALASSGIAGVIASSAGFPGRRHGKPGVIFGTAGTEDFNYVEMRLLGRSLTTPHRRDRDEALLEKIFPWRVGHCPGLVGFSGAFQRCLRIRPP